MKKVYICLGLMVVCIVAAVFLRKAANNAELDYEKVKVRVVSSEKHEKRVRVNGRTSTMTEYDVVVSYQGKEYDLKNAHDTYSWREGSEKEAYFANGKMYANEEGVRNGTLAGKAYLAAVVGAFAMFIVSMLLLSKVGGKKKEGGGPLQKVG